MDLKSVTSLLIRVVKSSPLSGRDREAALADDNFLYKCTFSFQKENLCPAFRAFPSSAGFQWTLAQNNPYTKEVHFGVPYSGTLQDQEFWGWS